MAVVLEIDSSTQIGVIIRVTNVDPSLIQGLLPSVKPQASAVQDMSIVSIPSHSGVIKVN